MPFLPESYPVERAVPSRSHVMPELPEVEITARRLRAAMPGRRIVDLEVPDPRLLRGAAPDAPPEQTAAEWRSRLTGAAFAGVRRRAKFLLLALDTGETL